jgi:hypothetical protein
MVCGGVHNLVLSTNDMPLGCHLYKYMKNEQFTDFTLVTEFKDIIKKITCHSIILISRSQYFYEHIVTGGETELVFNNMDYIVLKTIIHYLYFDDIGFLKEKKNLNQLFEYYKTAK